MMGMANLMSDVKIALRQLRRRPLFTFTAVLTLAIGMGVNAVAFTVVNGLLFKGPAASAHDDVGRILTTPGSDEGGNASLAEYQRFVEATAGTLDLAAEGRMSVAWKHEGVTETAWALAISNNYFSMVTVRPIAGRINVMPAANGPVTVVIGERFWRRKLASAPLAGLTLRLNNTDVGVAGVLPDTFTGPAGLYSPDVWLLLEDLHLFGTSAAREKRDMRWLFLLGRLLPGATVPAIQGQVANAVSSMAHDWPETHRERGARFRMLKEGNSEIRGITTAAAVAMGIIGLVLVIACFNVANLLLARAVDRERDMGIRAALGAGAGRLARLVMTEGFMIAGLAGLSALVLARWTQSLVGAFAIPIEVPQHIDLTPDARVVAFIGLLVLIAGVLPGLWPALSAARVDVLRVLGSQGANAASGRPSAMRPWLVGAQIVGSTAFLAIAALLIQSYGRLAGADMGFDRDRLLLADLNPASHGFDADRAERYATALVARTRALPGVTDVALADRAPFFVGFDRMTPVSSAIAPCEPRECPKLPAISVAPGYFKTMGIGLTAGREFERPGAPAEVIVNQPVVRQYWPDGQPIGQQLRLGDPATTVTVVGVTAKAHSRGLDRERPMLYVPLGRDHFEGGLTLIAHTAVPPESLVRPLMEAAQSVDPDVALSSVKTMKERMAVALWPFHTVSWLFSICGGLALILSTVGLVGVIVHSVSRRLREFGIRLSIGAAPRDLVVDVLRRSAWLLLPGLVVGLVLAAVSARLLQAVFIGINVLNPLTYVAVALVETAIVAVACIGPAVRAANVDPVIALRSE